MAVTEQLPSGERRYGTFMVPKMYPKIQPITTTRLEIDPEFLSKSFTGASGRLYYTDNGIYRENTEYIPPYTLDHNQTPIFEHIVEYDPILDPRQRNELQWMFDERRGGNKKKLIPPPIHTYPTPEIDRTLPSNPNDNTSVATGNGGFNPITGGRVQIQESIQAPEGYDTYPVDRVVDDQVNGGVRVGWYDKDGKYHRGNPPARKQGGLLSYLDYIQ